MAPLTILEHLSTTMQQLDENMSMQKKEEKPTKINHNIFQ